MKLQAVESLSRGSSKGRLLNLPKKAEYALNDFDDSYSVSDAAGVSNASTQRQRKNHIKVSVLMPSLQIMQEMEEDNQQQYTSRSIRKSTARFHSGHSQEATTPAGRNMIEEDGVIKMNAQPLPSSMRNRDSKVDRNSIQQDLASGLGLMSDQDSINQREECDSQQDIEFDDKLTEKLFELVRGRNGGLL